MLHDYILLFCSDDVYKLLMVGDECVGKTCLLLRFAVSYSDTQILLIFTYRMMNMQQVIFVPLE